MSGTPSVSPLQRDLQLSERRKVESVEAIIFVILMERLEKFQILHHFSCRNALETREHRIKGTKSETKDDESLMKSSQR